jgi:hypothetical protein
MTSRHHAKTVGASLAALAAAAAVVQTPAAFAQTADSAAAAPPAQPPAAAPTAAPNPGWSPNPTAAQSYADQYARWAQQNCVDQRSGNTAAGAIVGGALGAVAGAALTDGRASGALAGGALGAVTGAAVGATTPTSCPPGYVVRAGAPAFVYAGPYYDPALAYIPAWYQPWVWVDGRWIYEPYSFTYWVAPAYWRSHWVGRPWIVRHRP